MANDNTGKKFKYRAVMTASFPGSPADAKAFEDMGVELVIGKSETEDEIIKAARDADFLIPRGRQPVTRRVIDTLTRCRLISVMGIGYDGIDVKAATEHGICVNNVPDASVHEVSDHTFALLLACARRLFVFSELVTAGRWTETGSPELRKIWGSMSRMQGQTLGLVGFGHVPRTLTPKAQAFGLKVIAYDPYQDPKVARSMGVESVSLEKLLAESDFVSLHAALTPQTTNMMGPAQFKLMKPTAYLINTARGGLVDEAALLAALDSGKIAGAALDVIEPDPPKMGNPLIGRRNVIITPHAAHASKEATAEQYQRPGKEIGRMVKGEWPVALLNPDVKEKYLTKWREVK